MDVNTIASSTLLIKTAQTQQAMSISIMKQAAAQQNQMAALLAQSASQTTQTVPQDNSYAFSTYA